ncbi:MAG: nicotinate (nicotinamide) nucleotide adenylyltransferase [Planctomycetota bacterium]
MKIGMLGGSFDPVHIGHLWIGEAATEQLGLDRLHWIPSATQPLKPGGAVATHPQRLEMLRLAIAGRAGHFVDDREVRRDGVSYSVDTVEELGGEFPAADLYLIIGSDSLASMQRWHEPRRLLSRVNLAVVQRGGEPEISFDVLEGLVGPERIDSFRQLTVRMPVIEISSRELRVRVAQNRSVRHFVPRPVESYIEANQLYQSSVAKTESSREK